METIIGGIKIEAIASWLPENVFEMSSLAEEYGESQVASIIKTTGIERVRIASSDDTAADLCFRAAEHLICQEGYDREGIDGLVFVSQTPDYILPSTSIVLQNRLQLSQKTVCIDIHYGCSGYIYGLFQAAMWIGCGACRHVLVLAGDTTSRMINPKDKALRMVFGDCGTASLVTKGKFPMGFSIGSDGSGFEQLIVPAGGFRKPVSEKTSVLKFDEDKNGRTENDLYMDGMGIFNFAITHVHKNIDSLIDRMEWKKEDIDLFALHQANAFMVNYVRKKLKVAAEKVPVDVVNYGNTGPATLPLLFSDMTSSVKQNLDKVILSGFGVGLSWGSVAANMSDTTLYEPVNK